MREYGKVQTSFWGDDRVRTRLSDEAKVLFLYLLTGPHTTQLGCFRLPVGYVSEDLGHDPATVAEAFRELLGNGFIALDEGSQWVLIRGFLRFNKIENPNQGKAAARLFDQISDSNPLKRCLAEEIRRFAPSFPASALKRFETVPEELAKPNRNQEQEQEQEQEKKKHVVGQEAEPPDLIDTAVGLWNLTAARAGLPEVRKLDETRRRRLTQRLADGGLDEWRKALDAVERSRLCRGMVPGKDGAAPWRCNFDFLTSAAGFRKVLEGNYPPDIDPPAGTQPLLVETPEELWGRRISEFKRQFYWDPDWGPRPGRPGCHAPSSVLAQHGYGEQEAA